MLWCWRCRMDMPMLDDREFSEVSRLHAECVRGVKQFRERSGESLEHPSIKKIFQPVRDRYKELTGFYEANENAIMHHKLSLYGPPCRKCGKPLRTPKAKLCGSCMTPVEPDQPIG